MSGSPGLRGLLAATGALALLWPAAAGASQNPPSPSPELSARAWLLVDADDGEVLASRNASARRPVASTTKLMTAHLALRALPLGKRVTAPRYEALPGESLMGLEAGQRVSVRSLLYGLLLGSGNDAAVALADAVSGSVPRFVERMNETADRLGLRDTSYENPIGLDHPNAYSTAHDLADLTVLLRQDPVFRRIVDTARRRVPGADPVQVVNHNHLLARVPSVNGVKTGYTVGAGFVLVGSATRNGVTLVSVVLGAPTLEGRDAETLALLEHGFSLYRPVVAVKRGEPVDVTPTEGVPPAMAGRTVRVFARRDQRLVVEPAGTLAAPGEEGIERGERIGVATVSVSGRAAARVPLVAARAVAAESEDELPGWPWSVFVTGGAIVILIAAGFALRVRGGRGARGRQAL